MTIVLIGLEISKAMEITRKYVEAHVEPTLPSPSDNTLNVVLQGVVRISDSSLDDTRQILTKMGHILNIHYREYTEIKIL